MGFVARKLPALVLAFATIVPAPASVYAQEKPPIALVRTPRTLDVPRDAAWLAPETLGSFTNGPLHRTPASHEVKLSEEGLVLVVASCIIGGIILVYLVSRAT